MEQWQIGDVAVARDDATDLTIGKEYSVKDVDTPDQSIKILDDRETRWREMHLFTRKPRVLTLQEGMGVKDATDNQKHAIIYLCRAEGFPIDKMNGTIDRLNSYRDIYFDGQEIIGCSYIKTPVTFEQFISAILNTPQKPKEVEVKIGKATITFNGENKTIKMNFPEGYVGLTFDELDKLVRAKNEVSNA